MSIIRMPAFQCRATGHSSSRWSARAGQPSAQCAAVGFTQRVHRYAARWNVDTDAFSFLMRDFPIACAPPHPRHSRQQYCRDVADIDIATICLPKRMGWRTIRLRCHCVRTMLSQYQYSGVDADAGDNHVITLHHEMTCRCSAFITTSGRCENGTAAMPDARPKYFATMANVGIDAVVLHCTPNRPIRQWRHEGRARRILLANKYSSILRSQRRRSMRSRQPIVVLSRARWFTGGGASSSLYGGRFGLAPHAMPRQNISWPLIVVCVCALVHVMRARNFCKCRRVTAGMRVSLLTIQMPIRRTCW